MQGLKGRERLAYLVSMASVAAALVLQLLLGAFIGSAPPFILFFGAVILSAWLGGLGPGLSATLLSGLAATWVFIMPANSFSIGFPDVVRVAVFLVEGACISALCESGLHSERELRKSEARFRRVVDANIVGIVFWNATGEISEANDAFLQMVHYSREELRAGEVQWLKMTPPEYSAIDQQALSQLAQQGVCEPFTKEYLRKDGSRVPVLIYGAVLDGSPDQGVAFILDQTERRRYEQEREQLLANERSARAAAEQANRVKDEFLATLSHELRSPLNAVLGWSQILRTRELDDATQKQALAIIERNARAQNRLIEDLLDVSRIITGKLRLEIGPVSLAEVVEGALDTVRPAAEAKSIRLSAVIDPLAGLVPGDADRLQQVVWNLLSNAVKFTPGGGWVQVELVRKSAYIEITVADSGTGIAPEALPYVFERFRQADSSSTRVYGGLGLGLAIVRQLVELHGGTVTAESPGPGKGAIFTVRLPRQGISQEPHSLSDSGPSH